MIICNSANYVYSYFHLSVSLSVIEIKRIDLTGSELQN